MQGYDSASYGEAFADVYDDWYADISDVTATVEALTSLVRRAGALAVVELGVGTGRIAIPLAARIAPTTVTGIDSSTAMLARLATNQSTADIGAAAANPVVPLLADMVDGLPDGPLGVVFVAFNTFFNLGSADRQRACLAAVASRLAPTGCFVIEAYVPDESVITGSHVEVRSIAVDRVVLSVARYDGGDGLAEGQFVEFTESGGVRLRPWSIRSIGPDELDAAAADAGLELRERWETFAGDPYTVDSTRHVSIYGPATHTV